MPTTSGTSDERLGLTLLRALTAHSGDIISLMDSQGRLLFNSQAASRISGFSLEELEGVDTFQNIHPDDRAGVQSTFASVLRTPGAIGTVQYRYRRKAGGWTWMEAVASNQLENPDVRGVIANSRDISERRELEAKLELASRLTGLGTLVAGLAHELNNPLAIVSASQEVALDGLTRLAQALGGPEPVDRERLAALVAQARDDVSDAQDAGARAARVVADLVRFSAPESRQVRVRLADVVWDSLRWLRKSVPDHVTLETKDDGGPEVLGAPGQLGQVVINLVTNALRALPPDRPGTVRVSVGPAGDGRVRLEVRDDGVGMTAEVRERVFDPFFTTQAVSQNSGLGLAIVHSLVSAHGGTVQVQSEPGKGSTFRVELPAAAR